MADALRLAAVFVPALALVDLVMLAGGGRSASFETRLPEGVAVRLPADMIATTETLWSPEPAG